jgi:hypothetical protein
VGSDRATQLGFWSHTWEKFAWCATQAVEAANIGRALLTTRGMCCTNVQVR